MSEDNHVKNFYEEEDKYQESIMLTKELVQKVVFLNQDEFTKKIEIVDTEGVFKDFIDLFFAVTGRETNKYYYCLNQEDVKYYQLEYKKVYKMSEISLDLQAKKSQKVILNLEARAILAQELLEKTEKLKSIFSENIKKGDGSLATIEQVMILEKDVEYLDRLIEYLKLILDPSRRLKVLVAERDIYAFEKANEQYEKKTGVEKLFHKIFNTKKSVIEDMTNKNKYNNTNKK